MHNTRVTTNLINTFVEGARLDTGNPLISLDPRAGIQSYASTERRNEVTIDNIFVNVVSGIGVFDIAKFPEDNVRITFCALSLTLPSGYSAGLGRTSSGDLVSVKSEVSGRVETVSDSANGLRFLASDTPIKLVIQGPDSMIPVSGTVVIGYESMGGTDLSDAIAGSEYELDSMNTGQGGYEFTGGFTDRTTGQSGANDLGTNVQYTTAMAVAGQWMRFGFDSTRQVANDVEYWGETSPSFDQTKGLFGGLHMPPGVDNLFNFTDNGTYNQEVTTGDLTYSAATGSYDFTQCKVGDLAKVRFSFNLVPQEANTTVEVALIWATRDANDNITFTFPLTAQPIYYGTGSVGLSFLNRVEMSAYFASNEDVNARALPAIRATNPVLIQPLTTLCAIVR